MRRSRGYVPRSVDLPVEAEADLLGCGAELKSTFCVAKGRRAWVGHHIGDLKNYETLTSFTEGVEHFERLFAVGPEVVAHDLHPDYLSTRYALERQGVRDGRCPAPSRAPRGGPRRARDGSAGGRRDLRRNRLRARRHRLGRRAPGRRSRRVASVPGCSSRSGFPAGRPRSASHGGWPAHGSPSRPARRRRRSRASIAAAVDERSWLRRSASWRPPASTHLRPPAWVGCSTPWRRSAGSAPRVNYEGQAAVELEGISDPAERDAYPLPLIDGGESRGSTGPLILDARETVRAIASRPRAMASRQSGSGAGSTSRSLAQPPRQANASRSAHGTRPRRPVGGRVREPAADRASGRPPSGGRPRGPAGSGAAAQRRSDLLRAGGRGRRAASGRTRRAAGA